MPRTIRKFADGGLYHVLNRGNGRARIFHKDADYLAFLRVLVEGLDKFDVELLAWCLMRNDWHLVLRPRRGAELSRLMQWVTVTHTRRHHAHHHSPGGGHLYQGRFKSFPVQDGDHFLILCRYVEANALRARLVRRAQDWRWSSLGYRTTDDVEVKTARWPVQRPANWTDRVNAALDPRETDRLRASLERGVPFGQPAWQQRIAAATGLLSKLRPIGRPRKQPNSPVKQPKRRTTAKKPV